MNAIVNQDAEIEFLCCVAHGGSEVLDDCPITPDHFSAFHTRAIAGAALALHASGRTVSALGMVRALSEQDLGLMGGTDKALSLLSYVPKEVAPQLAHALNRCLVARRTQEFVDWTAHRLETWKHGTNGEEDFAAELTRRAAGVSVNADAEELMGAVSAQIMAKLDRMDAGEKTVMFQTSLHVWNRAFGGIGEGQFYAIAGRPETGKSALMEQLIEDCLDADKHVLIFEKDMSPQKLIERIACRSVGVTFSKYARGTIDRHDRDRIRQSITMLKETGQIHLYSPAGLTAEKLCAIARREIKLHGVSLVALDHIQALAAGKDFREGLTRASLTLRTLPTETGVPLITLAHLNRDGAKGRPGPENIKEFDQLYGDCDGMAILWRESNEPSKGDTTEINFLIAKNRDGRTWTEDKVVFNGPEMKFKNDRSN